MASDAFWDLNLAQWIKDEGNYKYEPLYRCAGFNDCIGFMPPILYHATAIFSLASGLEIYDAIYILIILISSLSILMWYFIIRRFDKKIAMLSLPLTFFLYKMFFLTVFTWGKWKFITMQIFLFAFIWILLAPELKKRYLLLGIFAASVFMSHVAEIIYIPILAIIYLAVTYFKEKDTKKLFDRSKVLAIAAGIAIIISSYLIIIIIKVWPHGPIATFQNIAPTWDKAVMANFGIVVWIIIIGALFGLYFAFKKTSNEVFFAYFLAIAGFANLIGFAFAFHARYYWPIYMSLLFGIAIYFILLLPIKSIVKVWRLEYTMILSLIIAGIVIYSIYQPLGNDGLMNSDRWQLFNWIDHNAEKDAKVYFFYGDTFSQNAILWTTKRVSYLANVGDIVDSIKNSTLKRYYKLELTGPTDTQYAYGSIFSPKFHLLETNQSYFSGKSDICSFDYYVFEKASAQPVLAQFNIAMGNELLKNNWMQLVANNQLGFIIKNTQPGKDCFPKEGVKIG